MNEADRMAISENPDQTAPIRVFTVLSVLSVLILRSFTVYNTLKILHYILREKYFDMVSED